MADDWQPILREFGRRLAQNQWGRGRSIWAADLDGRELQVEVHVTTPCVTVPDYVAEMLAAERYLERYRLYRVEGRCVQLATSYLDADLVAGSDIEREDAGPGGTYARLEELGVEPRWFQEDIRVRDPRLIEADLDFGNFPAVIDILRLAATESRRVVEVTRMALAADAYVLRSTFAA